MSKINLFIVYIVLLFTAFSVSNGKISDYRMCGNPECSVIIGSGVTLQHYSAFEPPLFISFPRNVPVRIFSKSAGSDMNLWGVEIQGRRGYVHKQYIKEAQVIIPSTKLIKMPTELLQKETDGTAAAASAQDAPPTMVTDSTPVAVTPGNKDSSVKNTVTPEASNTDSSEENTSATLNHAPPTISAKPETTKNELPAETVVDSVSTPKIPVNEPLAIQKSAYVTTTGTLTGQPNVDDDTEVQLEVIAPFSDVINSQENPPNIVAAALVSSNTPDTMLPASDQFLKDTQPKTMTTLNGNLEPITFKETLPISNTDKKEIPAETPLPQSVPPSTVQTTEPPALAPEALPVTGNTSGAESPLNVQTTVPAALAPDDSIVTSNTSGATVKPAELTVNADQSDSLDQTQTQPAAPADNSIKATTQPLNLDDASTKAFPSAEIVGQSASSLESNKNVNVTTNKIDAFPSSTEAASDVATSQKLLHIDDPDVETKVLLHGDEMNSTSASSSSEDWDKVLSNNTIDTGNTTDSSEENPNELNASHDEQSTTSTPSHYIDAYESLKNHDPYHPTVGVPPNDVLHNAPPSVQQQQQHQYRHQYTTAAGGGKVPPFYPMPTSVKPQDIHKVPDSDDEKVQEKSIKDAASEVLTSTEPEVPTSVNVVADTVEVPPSDSFVPPIDSFAPPIDSFAPPLNSFAPPLDAFSPPADSLGPPTEMAAQPPDSFEAPHDSLAAPPPPDSFAPSEGVGSVEEISPPSFDAPAPVLQNDDDIAAAETETVQDSSGVFSNLWTSIVGMFGSLTTPDADELQEEAKNFQQKVHDMLFSSPEEAAATVAADEYCENIAPDSCPQKRLLPPPAQSAANEHSNVGAAVPSTMDEFLGGFVPGPASSYDDIFRSLLQEIVGMSGVIVFTFIAGLVVLIFLLGHGCIGNNRREQALLSKLNILERKLMTSGKECEQLKNSLVDTRHKLTSIEDNSFGSNEMVIALKQELDNSKQQVGDLFEQIQALEKELDTATEAGLELNKMVTELLSNQSGSDSIINTVDDMQRQLNEQQANTETITAVLAEKSRENSELQVKLNEITDKYDTELEDVMRQNEALMAKYTDLEKHADEQRSQLEEQIAQLNSRNDKQLQHKTDELASLTKELTECRKKYDEVRLAHQASESRAQTLDDLVKQLKKGSSADELGKLMNVTDMKAKVLALTKEKDRLTDKLEGELDARKLLEDHVKVVGEEVSALRQGFNLAEKDKLEAQTRLEVLSTYFKDKETQLQKELSLKEAITMKQQGDTTSTVERIRSLQTDIQDLRSQNDSLKAEIEAQIAAHKAQLSAAENRAHESWLNARQIERRFEEARSDASALRRKLTSLAGGGNINNNNGTGGDLQHRHNSMDGLANELNAPSPILMDPTGSSIMPGLQFLPPPPFMAPPFLPPPPFMPPPPGEMRPPPLGRLMSPPPLNSRYSPVLHDDRDRYDRGGGGGGGRYSPDNRYDDYRHSEMYETETDFSPPPSPEPRSGGYQHHHSNHRGDHRERNYQKRYSPPPPPPSKSDSRSKKSSKGGLSSGSVDSLGSRKSHGGGKV